MALSNINQAVAADEPGIAEPLSEEITDAEKVGLGFLNALKWRARLMLWKYWGQQAQFGLHPIPDAFGEI